MQTAFNHNMLILAREARALSQAQLADAIGMSATNLSKIERGDIGIANDTLEKIASITQYPQQFFFRQGQPIPESLIYRKRQVVAQKLITPVHAQANIIRLMVQQLATLLSLPAFHWPLVPMEQSISPAAMAIALRQHWQVQQPIIPNLTQLMEAHGIITHSFPFGTPRIDSRSIITQQKQPIVITNSTMPGCRQRFSLAFELGHLCMHTFAPINASQDIAHEANLFAAELLMPEAAIRPYFEQGITIPILAQLKTKWKVSMIALLYRADDLGYLTPNQKRYLLQQFNSLKIRRCEPVELDIPPESPTLLQQLIAQCKTQLQLGTVQIAALLCLEVPELMELTTAPNQQ